MDVGVCGLGVRVVCVKVYMSCIVSFPVPIRQSRVENKLY